MKILVLSDIHYPMVDENKLASIIRDEQADKIVFLGDNIDEEKYSKSFIQLIMELGCRDYTLIKGDNEESLPYEKSLKLEIDGRSFKFVHGYQFNIRNDRTTGKIASALKKIHERVPVLAYAFFSKARSRTTGYLVLGHSHALEFFPRLKVACAGCLTTETNVYNDRGYIVISSGNGVTLTIKFLDGRKRSFEV
jgi:putative phosphoesterase